MYKLPFVLGYFAHIRFRSGDIRLGNGVEPVDSTADESVSSFEFAIHLQSIFVGVSDGFAGWIENIWHS